jgi:hypothetical protein
MENNKKSEIEFRIKDAEETLEGLKKAHAEVILDEAKYNLNKKFAGKFFKWTWAKDTPERIAFYYYKEAANADSMHGFSYCFDGSCEIQLTVSNFYVPDNDMIEISRGEFLENIKIDFLEPYLTMKTKI